MLIIKSFERGDLADFLAVVAGHLPHMNLVNYTTALHRLAKLTSTSGHGQNHLKRDRVFEHLLHSISVALDSLKPEEVQAQSLSNIAWSLATLKLPRVDLLSKVVALAALNLSSFQHFELCTFLWACAKLGAVDESVSRCSEPIFTAAAPHIVATASTLSFRCWANLLWAFATAKQYSYSLFSCAIVHMLQQVRMANCQELANTTWALGKVNFLHDELFCELATHALVLLDEFKPQELSNMIWGFGCVGFFHEEFFVGAAATLQRMELTTQHLANIMTAVVRAAPDHPLTRATILNLMPQCCEQVSAFKPQEVSATFLAVAKAFGNSGQTPLAVPGVVYRFVEIAAPLAISCLPNFSTQSLASLSGAFTRLRVCGAQHLIDAVSTEVSRRRGGGPCRTDLHDSFHALSLAEYASPTAAYKDPEQSAHVEELSFAPSQAPRKKESPKRRRGRAQTRAAGLSLVNGQDRAHDAGEARGVAASTGSYLPWHDAAGRDTRGLVLERPPYKALQQSVNHPIAAVGLSPGQPTTPWPPPGAQVGEAVLQALVQKGEERGFKFATGSDRAQHTQKALTPLVEGIYQHPGLEWNCSVKNSFLHVEFGYDSDDSTDRGSCAGGSSQRSSSVPSRLDHTEPAEEWHKRNMGASQYMGGSQEFAQEFAQCQRYSNDLAGLNWSWGTPGMHVPGQAAAMMAVPTVVVCQPLTHAEHPVLLPVKL